MWRIADIAYVQQGELFKDITELRKEVNGVKLAQDAQVKAFKDEVKQGAKVEIAQLVGYAVQHDTWLRPMLTVFMIGEQREDQLYHQGHRHCPGDRGNAGLEPHQGYPVVCWRAGKDGTG